MKIYVMNAQLVALAGSDHPYIHVHQYKERKLSCKEGMNEQLVYG